jgi:hypothetical protein
VESEWECTTDEIGRWVSHNEGPTHVYDPDTLFCCKMRYMRESGPSFIFTDGGAHSQHGRQRFHGQTLRERYNQQVKELAEHGYKNVSPKGNVYTGR